MAAEVLDGMDEVGMERGRPPHPRCTAASLSAMTNSRNPLGSIDLRIGKIVLI